eukprot:TRINITY_DN4424_c0_g1_i1.p1 TRINITY_DN4424_c0_g1~~TRINITY_DN4424_c0_g1_i1.p1  ORF type:complete len:109 (-),score=28.57 TRINITY_DN4424_c0_g1_i1:33-359(-)
MLTGLFDKHGIQSVFLNGNAMTKNKVLKAFKEPDSKVRVMMLDKSGTDLVEASHVILVDPVGTKEEARVLGRVNGRDQKSQVTVVRFVIKDTHERSDKVDAMEIEGKE